MFTATLIAIAFITMVTLPIVYIYEDFFNSHNFGKVFRGLLLVNLVACIYSIQVAKMNAYG